MVTDARPPDRPGPPPGVLHYQVLCYVALGAIFLAELQRGALLSSLLVFLVGLLATLTRLRVGPMVLLVALAFTPLLRQYVRRQFGFVPSGDGLLRPEDVLLCGAVLAFVVAHYRMQALVLNVFPVDPRRRKAEPGGFLRRGRVVPLKRAPRLVTPTEVGLLLLGLPVCALLAQALWAVFGRPREILGLRPEVGRLIVVAWVLGLGLLVARALLRTWEFRQLGPEAATLFLQDTLWHETRREQRRVNRWLSWRRIRQGRDR